ncbi:MAG TPA: UpxY family transcription antiterminator [Terriglobia bacterium]|jgi:transcription antitermination factor NusG|nr:UpxY family transcription antiterminator [Terriglobia bacterium]
MPFEKQPEWFALYTRHQHEKSVAQLLERKGAEVFLPLYKAVHRWKDRMKLLSLPLFPNYVFVLDGNERRGAILATPGVYDFVRQGGWPAPIPRNEIDAVRKAVTRGVGVEPHPFLNAGDRVRVKSGPLEGVEGILVRKKGLCRLVLSVELLERSIAVEVEVADIERVLPARGRKEFYAAPALAAGGF